MIVVLGCLAIVGVAGQEPAVRHLRVYLEQGRYYVDADVQLALTPAVREALHNGIGLVFEVRAEVKRENIMVPDSLVGKYRRRYWLEYRPLLERYVVTELGSGAVHTDLRLRDALAAIGRVRRWSLVEKDKLDPRHTYYVRVRGELLLSELPLPLQLHAYVRPSWWISTGWREVPLR